MIIGFLSFFGFSTTEANLESRAAIIIEVSLLFFFLSVVLILVIFFNRIRTESKSAGVNKLSHHFNTLISEYLFSGEELSITSSFFFEEKFPQNISLSSKQKRQVLIDCLLNLGKNLNGESEEKLNLLYVKLNLYTDSLKKLKSWKWYKVARGIRELSQMNYAPALDLIAKHLDSRQMVISQEAQSAYAKLKENEPLQFLDNQNLSITGWQQISIHNKLLNKRGVEVPQFSKWLHHKDPTIVEFCLRMISNYQQAGAGEKIINLLKSSNEHIKLLCIQVLGELEYQHAVVDVKEIFWLSSIKIKKAILLTIGKIGNGQDAFFITHCMKLYPDQLKYEGVLALKNLGERGDKELIKLKTRSEFEEIISHVNDPMLH